MVLDFFIDGTQMQSLFYGFRSMVPGFFFRRTRPHRELQWYWISLLANSTVSGDLFLLSTGPPAHVLDGCTCLLSGLFRPGGSSVSGFSGFCFSAWGLE